MKYWPFLMGAFLSTAGALYFYSRSRRVNSSDETPWTRALSRFWTSGAPDDITNALTLATLSVMCISLVLLDSIGWIFMGKSAITWTGPDFLTQYKTVIAILIGSGLGVLLSWNRARDDARGRVTLLYLVASVAQFYYLLNAHLEVNVLSAQVALLCCYVASLMVHRARNAFVVFAPTIVAVSAGIFLLVNNSIELSKSVMLFGAGLTIAVALVIICRSIYARSL